MRCPGLTPLALPWPIVPEGVYDPADLGGGKHRFVHPSNTGKALPPSITRKLSPIKPAAEADQA